MLILLSLIVIVDRLQLFKSHPTFCGLYSARVLRKTLTYFTVMVNFKERTRISLILTDNTLTRQKWNNPSFSLSPPTTIVVNKCVYQFVVGLTFWSIIYVYNRHLGTWGKVKKINLADQVQTARAGSSKCKYLSLAAEYFDDLSCFDIWFFLRRFLFRKHRNHL